MLLHVCLFACGLGGARASDFEQYELVGEFHFPGAEEPAEQGPLVFDNLSDGRLLAVSTLKTDPVNFQGTPQVYLESGVGTRDFQWLGALPLPPGGRWSDSGGAFLQVSQGASGDVRIAIGNNDFTSPRVGVFSAADLLAGDLDALSIDWYALPHSSAAWFDDRHLAIDSGDFTSSHVELLDTWSDVADPDHPRVVQQVAGASGGVGFDSSGQLYVANGFSNGSPGASMTGAIRRFAREDWQEAWTGGEPLAFETQGTSVATILSGGSLAFDHEDSMLVGGSNFFGGGQADFFALVPGPGLGAIPRVFDPDSLATSFYVLSYNEVLREFYAYEPFALDFPANIDQTRVYRFLPVIPGDLDCNGMLDFDDIDDFVLALSDAQAYEQQFGMAPSVKGDLDDDGDVDFDDIDEFVALLNVPARGTPQAVPEASSWVLWLIAAAWFWHAMMAIAQARSTLLPSSPRVI
jgi:hypothetical protein